MSEALKKRSVLDSNFDHCVEMAKISILWAENVEPGTIIDRGGLNCLHLLAEVADTLIRERTRTVIPANPKPEPVLRESTVFND